RPFVNFIVPGNAATHVTVSRTVAATFSEVMNPLTITTVTFTLKQGTTAVAGTVSYAGVTATFNPVSTLAPNAVHTATITVGARDLAGNALGANFVWSFKIGRASGREGLTVTVVVAANAANS